ncbi:MAG TPA: DUF2934 domain-containing protein [Beijerinckiaceae bacterium]|nr:DUF2934 domain-containing protein [Beijerinckiaceae bacterium]HVB90459.1 DUF2934 domain-containing protein [Beijerinckiaceae bacterium]
MEHPVQPSVDMQKVRQRAYEMWLAEGMKNGRDLEHWCAAEREFVATEDVLALARPKPPTSRKVVARKKTSDVCALATA